MSKNRHDRGSKQAGVAMGGKFARDDKPEASGAGLDPSPVTDDALFDEDTYDEILEQYDLTHGNTDFQDDHFIIEGPENTTLMIPRREGETVQDVKARIASECEDFDAAEEFARLWSAEFANDNEFSPLTFLDKLQSDERHFKSVARKINAEARANVGSDSTTSASTEMADLTRRDFEISNQMHKLQDERNQIRRDQMRLLAEQDYPGATQVVVFRKYDGDGEYLFEVLGALDKDNTVMDYEPDDGQGALSGLLYEDQGHGAFELHDLPGDLRDEFDANAYQWRGDETYIVNLNQETE